MIHQPTGGIFGTSADINLQAKEILTLKQHLAQILSECTGKTVEQILYDSERDYFMSPEEAIAYGLIDEIITTTPRPKK